MKIKVKNTDTGITFLVRIVKHGERYGRNMCLANESHRPLVEFYDTRHNFDTDPAGEMLGQFVSRYYADTLQESLERRGGVTGLCLNGEVRDWTLNAPAMAVVHGFMDANI